MRNPSPRVAASSLHRALARVLALAAGGAESSCGGVRALMVMRDVGSDGNEEPKKTVTSPRASPPWDTTCGNRPRGRRRANGGAGDVGKPPRGRSKAVGARLSDESRTRATLATAAFVALALSATAPVLGLAAREDQGCVAPSFICCAPILSKRPSSNVYADESDTRAASHFFRVEAEIASKTVLRHTHHLLVTASTTTSTITEATPANR